MPDSGATRSFAIFQHEFSKKLDEHATNLDGLYADRDDYTKRHFPGERYALPCSLRRVGNPILE